MKPPFPDEIKGKCDDCGNKEAVVIYADTLIAASHGYYQKLCKDCAIKLYERKIRWYKKSIDDLEAEE